MNQHENSMTEIPKNFIEYFEANYLSLINQQKTKIDELEEQVQKQGEIIVVLKNEIELIKTSKEKGLTSVNTSTKIDNFQNRKIEQIDTKNQNQKRQTIALTNNIKQEQIRKVERRFTQQTTQIGQDVSKANIAVIASHQNSKKSSFAESKKKIQQDQQKKEIQPGTGQMKNKTDSQNNSIPDKEQAKKEKNIEEKKQQSLKRYASQDTIHKTKQTNDKIQEKQSQQQENKPGKLQKSSQKNEDLKEQDSIQPNQQKEKEQEEQKDLEKKQLIEENQNESPVDLEFKTDKDFQQQNGLEKNTEFKYLIDLERWLHDLNTVESISIPEKYILSSFKYKQAYKKKKRVYSLKRQIKHSGNIVKQLQNFIRMQRKYSNKYFQSSYRKNQITRQSIARQRNSQQCLQKMVLFRISLQTKIWIRKFLMFTLSYSKF